MILLTAMAAGIVGTATTVGIAGTAGTVGTLVTTLMPTPLVHLLTSI